MTKSERRERLRRKRRYAPVMDGKAFRRALNDIGWREWFRLHQNEWPNVPKTGG